MTQFLANRLAFFNRRDYDETTFPGKLFFACNGRIPALWVQPPDGVDSDQVAIYMHGNSATLKSCFPLLKKMRNSLRCHVMAFEFPSYGLSRQLVLTIASIQKTVLDFVQFVADDLAFTMGNITLTSFCMGCSVAIYAASILPVRRLVCIAPLPCIDNYLRHGSRISALNCVAPQFLDNYKRANTIFCPTLVIQGYKDRTSTIAHVTALFQSLGTTDKVLQRYEHEKHIMDWDRAVIPAMLSFWEHCGETVVDGHMVCSSSSSKTSSSSSSRPGFETFRHLFKPPEEAMWPVLIQHYSIWVSYLIVVLVALFWVVSYFVPL